MTDYPQIVVGTYEEFILGYVVKQKGDAQELSLNLASHAHQGSVRCISSHGNLLASSGADEYINVYSTESRKEIATLTPHEGTVTCLNFTPDGSHLISGSQDGNIAITRCSDWKTMKSWEGAHKRANGVVGMDIHPSGKLLLSIGADHILRAWNLIKGRQAYATNFGKKLTVGNTLNSVVWSKDGDHYAITFGQTAEVYCLEKAQIVYTFKCDSRISCVDFAHSGLFIIGCEDGKIEVHDITKKTRLSECKGHEKRVKCLKFHKMSDGKEIVVSADSMGTLKLWKCKKKCGSLKLTAEANADCRIVCLTLLSAEHTVKTEDVSEEAEVMSKMKETGMLTSLDVVESTGSPGTPDKRKSEKKKKRKSTQETPGDENRKLAKKEELMTNSFSEKKSLIKKRFSTSKWEVT